MNVVVSRHGSLVRRLVPAVELHGQLASDMGRAAVRAVRALRQAAVGAPAQLREEHAALLLVA